MITAHGHHGALHEVLFEQRTPSTLRGYLNLSMSGGNAPAAAAPFPRSVLWRLRIGEGSTMLCSKLCGIMSVQSAADVVDESISITLAVRTGSSSSLPATLTSTANPLLDDSANGRAHGASLGGLPPLATPPPSPLSQIPAWVRKTSRLKVQWIELSQSSTPRQTQQSVVKGNDGVTSDVATAQRALQNATRDRSLMEAMFRIGGSRVQSLDIGCTFSDTPLSARNTSRFSSMRSLSDSNGGQLSASRVDRDSVSHDVSPGASPLRSARGPAPAFPSGASPSRGRSKQQQQHPLSSEATPTLNASVASAPPLYHKPFWFGFIVGGVFGATGVLTMLGQSGQLRTIVEQRKELALALARSAAVVARDLLSSAKQQTHLLQANIAALIAPKAQ